MIVGVISVGVMTVGVLSVGVMTLSHVNNGRKVHGKSLMKHESNRYVQTIQKKDVSVWNWNGTKFDLSDEN